MHYHIAKFLRMILSNYIVLVRSFVRGQNVLEIFIMGGKVFERLIENELQLGQSTKLLFSIKACSLREVVFKDLFLRSFRGVLVRLLRYKVILGPSYIEGQFNRRVFFCHRFMGRMETSLTGVVTTV